MFALECFLENSFKTDFFLKRKTCQVFSFLLSSFLLTNLFTYLDLIHLICSRHAIECDSNCLINSPLKLLTLSSLLIIIGNHLPLLPHHLPNGMWQCYWIGNGKASDTLKDHYWLRATCVPLSLSAIFAFRTWFPTSHPELFQRHLHANDESCNQDWEATSRARRVKQFVMWEKVFLSIKIRVFRIRFDPCGQSSLSFNDENNEKSENIFLPPTTLTTPLRGQAIPKTL